MSRTSVRVPPAVRPSFETGRGRSGSSSNAGRKAMYGDVWFGIDPFEADFP